ncbi:MAG: UDP-N-acetylglucosamine 2-epimerase (non-hydrolyzing) [Desulfuromonas sp.]|nr:UDP-N-acetylglucosamine 2-epimerase (non-hydrolyzing) [Desulfuromonas sp.]
MCKILTIVGARPQFIKASMVSRAIAEHNVTINDQRLAIDEVILHTGQHFDANMSDIFFNQLNIPRPDIHLDIHGGNHGAMTGYMLAEIEQALLEHKPDRVLVYGDTNSTLAGALAAAKLHIPVAHVEAGLRSFNMQMPEEINRVLTDRISDILFCPTEIAIKNLIKEGVETPKNDQQSTINTQRIFLVGDVMQDAALLFAKQACAPQEVLLPEGFVLTTLHRAENTDCPERLANIVTALNQLHHTLAPVVLPLHPRARQLIAKQGLNLQVHVINPVGYFEMLWLLDHCDLVLTDSGGVQKEAFFFGKACVTMRDQTEWVELVEAGANELVGADEAKIVDAARRHYGRRIDSSLRLYGAGEAAKLIVRKLPKYTTSD